MSRPASAVRSRMVEIRNAQNQQPANTQRKRDRQRNPHHHRDQAADKASVFPVHTQIILFTSTVLSTGSCDPPSLNLTDKYRPHALNHFIVQFMPVNIDKSWGHPIWNLFIPKNILVFFTPFMHKSCQEWANPVLEVHIQVGFCVLPGRKFLHGGNLDPR